MFSTSCRGSSIRVYTSDSSCFLAPATCSSVTLADLSADTTALIALPGKRNSRKYSDATLLFRHSNRTYAFRELLFEVERL